jgi:beta-glucosidase
MKSYSFILTCLAVLVFFTCKVSKFTLTQQGNIHLVAHSAGPTLGYSSVSGIKILEKDKLAFKDLNKNGSLDIYEDWGCLPISAPKTWHPK